MLSNGIVSAKNLHGFAELIRSDRPNPFSISLLSNILYQSSAFFEAAMFSDPLRNFAEQIQRKALNLSTERIPKGDFAAASWQQNHLLGFWRKLQVKSR